MEHTTQKILNLIRHSPELPITLKFNSISEAKQYRDYIYTIWRNNTSSTLRPMIRLKGASLILYRTTGQLIQPKEVKTYHGTT